MKKLTFALGKLDLPRPEPDGLKLSGVLKQGAQS